ncbi:MAG: glycosyltransferase family 2 protein [Nodosilinea sp.]
MAITAVSSDSVTILDSVNIFNASQQLIDNHVHETRGLELCIAPIVSVVVITFNDKDFIRESIDSVISQQTNFPYEVIISNDCSTDGTIEIIQEYQNVYPDRVRLLIADRNLWKPLPGVIGLTSLAALQACRGKYIALSHGDDYWTDPTKLQKQVDFLEANPDFSICFHKVKVLENSAFRKDDLTKVPGFMSDIHDLAKGNYIHTTSCVFRNNYPSMDRIGEHFSRVINGDYYLHMMNAQHGKIFCINGEMAVYRVHDNGVWATQSLQYRILETLRTQMYIYKDLQENQSMAKEILRKSIVNLSIYLTNEYPDASFEDLGEFLTPVLIQEIGNLNLELVRARSIKAMFTAIPRKILSKVKGAAAKLGIVSIFSVPKQV